MLSETIAIGRALHPGQVAEAVAVVAQSELLQEEPSFPMKFRIFPPQKKMKSLMGKQRNGL